jgi:AraC-like DNA-binding protein
MDASAANSWWILHERARRHYWSGEGWLSVKSFAGGRANYRVSRSRHAVDDGSYLILNHGQHYEIEIDQRTPVESFCLFFAPEYVRQVSSLAGVETDKLLDDPAASRNTIHFFEKNYSHDRIISPALRELRAKHRFADPGWIDERLRIFIEKLVTLHSRTLAVAHQLPNIRRATREELYRRVCRARDFADAMFAERVTLVDLASVAALSPNHLLRTFKHVFHETPHQFLTARRVKEAKRLLAMTDLPVTQICFSVGFDSLGSFSSLFKQHTAFAPSEYRRKKGDFREAAPRDSRDHQP